MKPGSSFQLWKLLCCMLCFTYLWSKAAQLKVVYLDQTTFRFSSIRYHDPWIYPTFKDANVRSYKISDCNLQSYQVSHNYFQININKNIVSPVMSVSFTGVNYSRKMKLTWFSNKKNSLGLAFIAFKINIWL
jgi:hypothetical protein